MPKTDEEDAFIEINLKFLFKLSKDSRLQTISPNYSRPQEK